MHADQLEIDGALVRRLVDTQLPQWSHLPLTPVASSGTVSALFRLGQDLVVRLPLVARDEDPFWFEQRWLPRIAPLLPVPTAEVVATGEPGLGYPCGWVVSRWLDGATLRPGRLRRPDALGRDLAAFVSAVRTLDPSGAPTGYRGGPLREREPDVREYLALLRPEDGVDVEAAARAWDAALAAPEWSDPPLWVHGDLLPGNLLLDGEDHLVGVIDFECAGVGDPACDLMAAWTVLPASARAGFRASVGVDDATWARARGWALVFGVVAIPYYRETNVVMTANARYAIAEVLADS